MTMSKNKILALIGAILYTFTPIIGFITGIGFFAMMSSSTFQSGYLVGDPTGDPIGVASIIGSLGIIVGVITTILCVLAWIAFVKLDGKTGHGWKIFLLVLGIIQIVFGVWFYLIGAAPGILFILAFALRDNQNVSHEENNPVETES